MNEVRTNAAEFTVSEISAAVKNTIEDSFGHVRVRGEVGRLSRPGSGHLYFDLKDDRAVMSAVAWKSVAGRWRFQPEQGLEVIVTGRLTTFAGQSKYQIIVENVEPAGVGALMALLEERRKKLAAEGLFAPERKQKLPYLPRVIGVATSPTGAVIRDILHRLEDRFPTHVLVWSCRVQGDTCASEIAAAVRGFNTLAPDGDIPRPDLIIVARGGGSVEDLWGFNEEDVVRAVADSAIPVISAVGHETDTTLIDYAADMRAPTPTGAAEMAVPVRAELIAYVEDLGQRQRNGARRISIAYKDRLRAASAGLPRPLELLSNARQRLDLASEKLGGGLRVAYGKKQVALTRAASQLSINALRKHHREAQTHLNKSAQRLLPAFSRTIEAKRREADRRARLLSPALERMVTQRRRGLAVVQDRLKPMVTRAVTDRGRRLQAMARLFESLDYKTVLRRGFAIVRTSDQTIARNAADLSAGDVVSIQFADGKKDARIGTGEPAQSKSGSRSRAKPSSSDDQGGQSSLF